MTKKKSPQSEVLLTPDTAEIPTHTSNGVPLGTVVPNQMADGPSRLSDIDRMALELARQQRLTALADAKAAIAQNEKAELAYKYVVLQLYMKYGLTDADAISESGEIVKNGALMQQAKTQ